MNNGCLKISVEMVKKNPHYQKQATRWKVNRLNLGGKAKIYNGGQKNLGLCEKALPSNSSVGFCS